MPINLPVKISLRELRELVEAVAGTPDMRVEIQVDPKTNSLSATTPGNTPVSQNCILEIDPPLNAPVNRKNITFDSTPRIVLWDRNLNVVLGTLSDCDMAAWTVSAFEKFFVPYYVTMLPAAELEQFRRLMESPKILAALHLPRSYAGPGAPPPPPSPPSPPGAAGASAFFVLTRRAAMDLLGEPFVAVVGDAETVALPGMQAIELLQPLDR
jgi:hypothetical protein